ncbi:MAG TPA: MFS transporter [Bryobacteraceae bacterium]|nr:MFS transporter [Bryobacteraceae bacterium]
MRKSATFAIATLFAINILNFYDRNVAGAVVEPMRREFHLNDTEIGLLTTAMTLLYAIVGVPIGRVADLWSRKKLLAWGVVIWSLLTASTYLAVNYAMVLVSRLGVGVGEATCAPTATSWLGDLVPRHKRARVLALFMLGVPIGGALSYFFSGPIAQAFGPTRGWRVAMIVAAAPALLLIPALFASHEPHRGASDGIVDSGSGVSMWSVLKIPTLWWIIASGALVNFNMYAIGTFMPAMLGRIHGLNVAKAGISTGILYIVGGVLGGIAGGWIGDHIIRSRENGRMLASAVISMIGVPFAYYGAIQGKGHLTEAVILWTIAYGTLNTYYGLIYSSIQDIVTPAQRGATMALYFMAMYVCGASFGSAITGRLSDHFASVATGGGPITEAARAIGLQQAMVAIPVVSIGLAFVLWMGSRTVHADIVKCRELAAAAAAARA